MKIISQIPYKGTPLNFMVDKNFVGYSFELDGKPYGQKTELKTKKRDELVGALAALSINAVETFDHLKNGENTNDTTTSGA